MSPSDSELTFTFPDADLCRDGEICARELTVIPLSAPISMRPPPSHTPSQAQIEDRDNTGTELQQPVEADKSVQVGPAANLDPPTDVGSVVERFPAGIRNGNPVTVLLVHLLLPANLWRLTSLCWPSLRPTLIPPQP